MNFNRSLVRRVRHNSFLKRVSRMYAFKPGSLHHYNFYIEDITKIKSDVVKINIKINELSRKNEELENDLLHQKSQIKLIIEKNNYQKNYSFP